MEPEYRSHTRDVHLPYALLAVGTPLDRNGHDVTIVDQQIHPDWRARLEAALAGEPPVCLGVSSMTGWQIKGGIEAAGIVRARRPEVPIVWGGVHPSLTPEQSLEDDLVDVVVVGEGERTMPDLVQAFETGRDLGSVWGIAFKSADGSCTTTEPRDPFPMDDLTDLSFRLFDTERYVITNQHTGRRSLSVLTSKGCGHTCAYCYNIRFNQKRFRAMGPDRVLDTLRRMVRDFDLGAFYLLDDNFFQNRDRVRRICEGILGEGLDILFNNANCRVDYVARYSVDFLKLIKRAGIRELRLGIESGSDRIQKDILKYTTYDQVIRANRKLKEAGIIPFYNFMIGFPTEGRREIRRTLRLMSDLIEENPGAVISGCGHFTPFPGTDLFHESVAKGWDAPATLRDWTSYHCTNLHALHHGRGHLALLDLSAFVSRYLDPKFQNRRIMKLYTRLLRALLRRGLSPAIPSLLLYAAVKAKGLLKGVRYDPDRTQTILGMSDLGE